MKRVSSSTIYDKYTQLSRDRKEFSQPAKGIYKKLADNIMLNGESWMLFRNKTGFLLLPLLFNIVLDIQAEHLGKKMK